MTVKPPIDGDAGTSSASILRAVTEAETVYLGPNTVSFLLSGEETGGQCSLTRFTIAPPPAASPPPHRHLDAHETIYVVEGTLDCTIEDASRRLEPGGVMHVPRGILHGLANPGPDPTTILVVLSPPGFEGYWRDAARLLARSESPPAPSDMLDLQRQYHMESGGHARRFD